MGNQMQQKMKHQMETGFMQGLGFPSIKGPLLGVPIIRIIVLWGLYWRPLCRETTKSALGCPLHLVRKQTEEVPEERSKSKDTLQSDETPKPYLLKPYRLNPIDP